MLIRPVDNLRPLILGPKQLILNVIGSHYYGHFCQVPRMFFNRKTLLYGECFVKKSSSKVLHFVIVYCTTQF